MKIARVVLQPFNDKQPGEIFDVIPSPVGVMADFLREVEVEDDFDKDVMDATIEDGVVTFSINQFKVDARVQMEIDKQVALEKTEALKYLADTDWYIIRELDSGVTCPQEIKDLRAAARLKA